VQKNLAIAAGSINIVTGLAFGILPFVLSYYYVAGACLWDWVVVRSIMPSFMISQTARANAHAQFFIWAAVFAIQHKYFGDARWIKDLKDADYPSVDQLIAAQWFDLGAMFVVLSCALMGPICLLIDRRNLVRSRTAV
jgi:hypothetical protein